VIWTDLPTELLSEEATDLLQAFADANFNPQSVAEERRQPLGETWRSLVAGVFTIT